MTNKKISKTQEILSTTESGENRTFTPASDSPRPILPGESDAVSERIKEVVAGEPVAAFARQIGLSESVLRAYIKGQKKPGMKSLIKIASPGGHSIDWLASGRLPKFKPSGSATLRVEEPATVYVSVPLYNNVQAAAGAGALVGEEIADGFMRFSEEWLRVELGARLRDLCLIRSTGDSMEPTFRSGDVLLVDRRATNPDREGIYIMRSGASLLVKRLQLLPGRRVRVFSDNPLYQPYELLVSELGGDDVQVIGRVVWSGRRS